MTGKRKLLIVIAAVFLLLAAVLLTLWSNLDRIAKGVVETFGSRSAGTAVRVGRIDLQLLRGAGTIEGLTVDNPRGYSSPHIISFGGISVRISPGTVTGNPVVIDDVHIASPTVVYEVNDAGVANVEVFRKKLGSGHPVRTTERGGTDEEKRVRIRRLVIENAKVEVRLTAPGAKPRILTLPRFEMTDIGGAQGSSPEAAANRIASAILAEVSREVGKAGAVGLIENAAERALRRK